MSTHTQLKKEEGCPGPCSAVMRVREAMRKETARRAVRQASQFDIYWLKDSCHPFSHHGPAAPAEGKARVQLPCETLALCLEKKFLCTQNCFLLRIHGEQVLRRLRGSRRLWLARHSGLAWQLSSAVRHLVEDQERGKDSRSVRFHNAAVQQHLIQNDVDFIQIKHYLGYIKEVSLRI